MQLLKLRQAGTAVTEAVNEAKLKTDEGRNELDAKLISLQNLLYEKHYYLKETRQELSYKSKVPVILLL